MSRPSHAASGAAADAADPAPHEDPGGRRAGRFSPALPFFGASIPGFVGLLTGRGPFSPAFALIPGRSMNLVSRPGYHISYDERGRWLSQVRPKSRDRWPKIP